MTTTPATIPALQQYQRPALIVGLAGGALGALGYFVAPAQFFRSYLFAYLFWLGLPLGCMAILMLQHLTGGRWGLVIRRPLESASRMIPLMAILFIPIILGMGELYVWTHEQAVRADPLIAYKQPYLNTGAFLIRAAIYFLIWLVGAWLLNTWSAAQDRTGEARFANRMQALSGPGILLYVLTVTFAAVDWVMSIDPHWYSTIYGLIFVTGQALAGLSAMIVLLALLSGTAPLRDVLTRDDFHDLGNLLMALVLLWAYMQFSQFLIIWMGNIAEGTPFYIHRMEGLMGAVGLALIVLHFSVPFLLLLWRRTKRSIRALALLATGILVMRFVDLFWIVMPTFAQAHHGADDEQVRLHWLDFVMPVALGGIWVAVFIWQVGRWPLLPVHDPRLAEEPAHG